MIGKTPGPHARQPVAPGIEAMDALLRNHGIALSRHQVEQLWTYHQLLRQYNPELNLTRIHNFEGMVLKLYVDSILPGRLIELPSPLLDIGTGPGMPGIPLKIAFPHLRVLLAESRAKRVEFLKIAVERLGLREVEIIGRGIGASFEDPVAGVITRAVETIDETLDRVRGCLAKGGLAIFMKGPHCDDEIRAAESGRLRERYRLLRDLPYSIPHTPNERRLVVFEKMDEPIPVTRTESMRRHRARKIESEQNELFKDLRKLLGSRGVKKEGKALVFGTRQVAEVLRDFPDRCEAWISSGDESLPPPGAPESLAWYQLSHPLFDALDIFGAHAPFLLVAIPETERWDPAEGLPPGCSVLIPFQDPENVGSVIRSAAAFGADRVILLAECANPYHPKALRASGGSALRVKLLQGPSLDDLPEDLALFPLSAEGTDISSIDFPADFGFLPGIEGPGLPEKWRRRALAIPMRSGVESLNASVAASIALYLWSEGSRQ